MKKYPLRPKFSYLTTVFLPLTLLLLVAVMGMSTVVAQEPAPTPTTPNVPNLGASNQGLVSSLAQSGAQISYHSETGTARFISAQPGRPIIQPAALQGGASKEAAARGFLTAYGPLFGIRDPNTELVRENEKKPDAKRTFERFQQVYNSVPVIGGELIVQVDSNNNILSANGETLPKIALSTTPAITAATASQMAVNLIAKIYNQPVSNLTASTPLLSIYNPVLIGPGLNFSQLVWRIEVTPNDLQPIREFVLIDAQRGGVALHFNQTDTVLSRQVYTANNTTAVPGTLLCNEGNSTCGNNADAQAAYASAGDTYNYYFNHFGRNSINNAGMVIKSTVHYSRYPDPYNDNAYWSGTQMVYGDARTYPQALDVVAHELTHGVTQYESNLFYYYQSGAINESLSDVFGELVQQEVNPAGVKWLIAEDVSPAFDGGYLRSMSDPTSDFSYLGGDPDKMSSFYYWPYSDDNGGVHENSGVNNKAAYLMAHGDTFNNITVNGIGNDKTAQIYYEAQTNLLTSGSSYADLYDALYQACFNVVGKAGIVAADCQQVRNATNAVEMYYNPSIGSNSNAPLCPAGQNPDNLFSDDFEAGAGKWTFVGGHWSFDWPYTASAGRNAHSGLHFLFADDYPPNGSSSYAVMKTGVTIPANAYLHFFHYEWFTYGNFDGGVVEYSADGGAWTDAGQLIDDNPYNGTILNGVNPLGGQDAFVGNSFAYTSSRLNLSSLVGKNVIFRWRMGLDNYFYNTGWLLDDVNIYSCGPPPANDSFAGNTPIPSLPYTSPVQSNGTASLEFMEPKGSCEGTANIKKTVWYRYTANANQKVTFSATDSIVVKGISVWTGSGLGALTQVGCGTPGANTSVAVNVDSGTTYFIRVGSSNGVSSNFTVQAGVAPANDDFANAIDMTTGFAGFIDTEDVNGASVETTDQAATCGGTAFRTVWYKYTALGSNELTVDTANVVPTYDTVLSIWTGATPGALTQVGCNDDVGAPTTSRLVLNTTPGVTYFIRVGSKGGSPTNLKFTMGLKTITNAAPLRNFFTAGNPTLTWNRVTNATGYTVQISKSQTFAGTPVITSPLLPSTQLFWQIAPTLTEDGVYYWRVSANGGTTWSTGDSFVISLH